MRKAKCKSGDPCRDSWRKALVCRNENREAGSEERENGAPRQTDRIRTGASGRDSLGGRSMCLPLVRRAAGGPCTFSGNFGLGRGPADSRFRRHRTGAAGESQRTTAGLLGGRCPRNRLSARRWGDCPQQQSGRLSVAAASIRVVGACSAVIRRLVTWCLPARPTNATVA